MAGVADRAFRKLCVENGAAYVVGEMVSCKGLCFGDAKSEELLELDPAEHPAAVQLFGDDPDTMARAARRAMARHPGRHRYQYGLPCPQNRGKWLRERADDAGRSYAGTLWPPLPKLSLSRLRLKSAKAMPGKRPTP